MTVAELLELLASLKAAHEANDLPQARALSERALAAADRLPGGAAPCTAALLRCLPSLAEQAGEMESIRSILFETLAELAAVWDGATEFAAQRDEAALWLVDRAQLFLPAAAEPEAASAPAAAVGGFLGEYDYSQFEDVVQDYLNEGGELVDALETDLMSLTGADAERLRRIFRAAHTFKGMSGMTGLQGAYTLTHAMEEKLEKVRDGKLPATPEMEELMLRCVDYLRQVLARLEARENPLLDPGALVTRLQALKAGAAPPPPEAAAAAEAPGEAPEEAAVAAAPAKAAFLRVEVRKLDAVMEQVGEILVEKIKLEQNQRDVNALIGRVRKQRDLLNAHKQASAESWRKLVTGVTDDLERFAMKFGQNFETMNRVTDSLQEGVMKMRLVPLSQIFGRFPRLVRDLSNRLGKKIQLKITGEATEIDKGMCELLPDPLIHLLRNSLDHGLENVEERLDRGKPEVGTIHLRAYYEGDKVTIEIADDGRGIDAEKIAASAVKKGLISAEEAAGMTKQQKLKLIFQPGFSTAEAVTDLSGRGVGMDVVRNTVEKLNGVIDVDTKPGAGTTVKLRLPITLAILRILLFRLGRDTLSLPLYNVNETIIVPETDIHQANNGLVTNLRGNIIPLIDLHQVLGAAHTARPTEKISIVIVDVIDRTFGLIVDDFTGKSDIIIKNFGSLLKKAPFVSGGAIMGDGEVVLVLDPLEIVREAGKYQNAPLPAAARVAVGAAAAPVATGRPRLLVVEDSPTQNRFICNLLTGHGYQVDSALSGEEALDKLRTQRYDLISTDIVMPGIDGYEFVRRLRKLPAGKLTPVIALSQKGEKPDRMRGFEAGIDEYIAKPLQEAQYVATVEAALNRAKLAASGE